MGMPTLKRFARPLDWVGIDAVLRGYARTVREGACGQQARRDLPILLVAAGRRQVPEEKQATRERAACGRRDVVYGHFSLQALPSMTLRVPGESRRHLRARRQRTEALFAKLIASLHHVSRHVSISSPFPRQHAAEDVFLFLHLTLGYALGSRRVAAQLAVVEASVCLNNHQDYSPDVLNFEVPETPILIIKAPYGECEGGGCSGCAGF